MKIFILTSIMSTSKTMFIIPADECANLKPSLNRILKIKLTTN